MWSSLFLRLPNPLRVLGITALAGGMPLRLLPVRGALHPQAVVLAVPVTDRDIGVAVVTGPAATRRIGSTRQDRTCDEQGSEDEQDRSEEVSHACHYTRIRAYAQHAYTEMPNTPKVLGK